MTKDNILLLDCTLRDGGYNNDWNFGRDTLLGVAERVVSSGIEWMELGFLDARHPFDPNRSIMPDTASMRKIYGRVNRERTKFVGMIDFGTCGIENIEPQSESFLDGIRVIFKKHLREPALSFCRQLKERGYLVFSQLVSITSYTDDEMMDLIRLVNETKPYAVSIVDTYGLLHKGKLFHYYEMLDRHLDPEILIGYHSHNNFQLGYANSIELMNHHAGSARTLLCDGSLFGMGKGAGNAPLELLATYVNENFGWRYHVSPLLEAIDANVMPLYNAYHWGYSLKAFMAASNDCHPNYVNYLVDKRTLSMKSVGEILQRLEGDKKLLYDKNLIEQLYVDYQKNTCDDARVYPQLAKLFEGRNLLVLGPGSTMVRERGKVEDHVIKEQPFVISINCVPEGFRIDCLFLTNTKRYGQQVSAIAEHTGPLTLIATSNLSRTNGSFDYTLDYESLIDREAVFMDNSFIMLLKVLIRAGVKRIALAGFDGYSVDADNYYASKMEYDFVKRLGSEINNYVNHILPELKKSIDLHFVTTTQYES